MRAARLISDSTSVAVVTLVVLSLCILLPCSAKDDDDKVLADNVEKYGSYVVKATFSFLYPYSYPPKTEEEQKALCKSQTEAFKAMREQTKGAPSIVRRGFLSVVTSRQHHHRKYCTNTNSDASKKFLAATKCIMENKFGVFRETDAVLVQTINEIARRNYTDPSVELKQLCCLFFNTKQTHIANISPECNQHREIIEELLEEQFGKDLELVCEEDDKLAIMCPKLEPLQFKRIANYSPPGGKSSAGLVIYLIATLGEPNDPAVLLN